MCKTDKLEQNWFIGTIEIGGYSVPVVGRGVTKKDAEQEAFRRVVDVWSNCLELDGKLDLDLLDWWPTSVSD
jgi:hypothetical protein